MEFVFLSAKPWHDQLFLSLSGREGEKWHRISEESDFTIENLNKINPSKIFIPHWSYIISEKIFSVFECIVFHITDLPYGRGGSPLQNLIVKGHTETKISAIKIDHGIDTGAIYLKRDLSLNGTALQIFERAAPMISSMIASIIDNSIIPNPQVGEPTIFKRRKPVQGNISELSNLDSIYDHIRMLDCEGYPAAYIETDNIKVEFSNVSYDSNKQLIANVRITKK